jgi:hypothetical protein
MWLQKAIGFFADICIGLAEELLKQMIQKEDLVSSEFSDFFSEGLIYRLKRIGAFLQEVNSFTINQ